MPQSYCIRGRNSIMNNALLIALLGIAAFSANAIDSMTQSKLMDIAAKEAQIANIGANKYMMLYGTGNPIPIIQRWNNIEHRQALTNEQISQINQLEIEKQNFLKEVSNK